MKIFRKWILGLAAILAVAQSYGVDLVGRVTHPDGSPITNATILIYTAGPQTGTSSLCPSCYADCRKQALSGPNGEFAINDLDPALLFRLLVLAPELESKFVDKVNPALGEVKVTLEPLDLEDTPPEWRIAGLVIGEDGAPVAGATIHPQGVGSRNGGQGWGRTGAVDEVAVSDAKGHFLLRCKKKVELVYAMAFARDLAPRPVQLQPGRDYLVRMQEGVQVTGRVMVGGKPVAGAVIGALPTSRKNGEFFTSENIATDNTGHFLLRNLPPDMAFVLFGTMDSLEGKGTLSQIQFTTGKSKTTTSLGNLVLQAGFRVSGQIVLTDGKPVPAQTRLMLSRSAAWDHSQIELDPSGRFDFRGVPSGGVTISLRLNGYKFSTRNPSLDWLNNQITGTVNRDITNLTILLDPGEFHFLKNDERPEGIDVQPRDKPLRSAKP